MNPNRLLTSPSDWVRVLGKKLIENPIYYLETFDGDNHVGGATIACLIIKKLFTEVRYVITYEWSKPPTPSHLKSERFWNLKIVMGYCKSSHQYFEFDKLVDFLFHA